MNDPLIEIKDIRKAFGAVQALKGISFTIDPGEIVALVGDNGAGKSTLVKIISGLFPPTSGEIIFNDKLVKFRHPSDALNAGIETVYQHLALIEQLDVADNVFLGRETTRWGAIGRFLGVMNRKQMRVDTRVALDDLHIKIPAPTMPVRMMSGGQRQAVAIGRAITWGRQLLILDEPTAALGVEETEQVLQMIERLRDTRKIGLLIISHNMRDVYRIADKIVVLRQGVHAATLDKTETNPNDIVAYITGAKDGNIVQVEA
ncbi:MAG: sugar ABC transporter ATP-binding protein [Anaerolineaceae bacterium]|nr:MAG: sugar ABC transporter ATP-binding protein [Anaerolineaceae bacterium]